MDSFLSAFSVLVRSKISKSVSTIAVVFILSLSLLAQGGSWVSVSNTPVVPKFPEYAYQYTCTLELSDRKTHFVDGSGEEYILVSRLVETFEKRRGNNQASIKSHLKTTSQSKWQVYRHYSNRRTESLYEKTDEASPVNLEQHEVRLYVNAGQRRQSDSVDDRVVFNYSVAQVHGDRTFRWSRSGQNFNRSHQLISGVVKTEVDYSAGKDRLWIEMQVDCKKDF